MLSGRTEGRHIGSTYDSYHFGISNFPHVEENIHSTSFYRSDKNPVRLIQYGDRLFYSLFS